MPNVDAIAIAAITIIVPIIIGFICGLFFHLVVMYYITKNYCIAISERFIYNNFMLRRKKFDIAVGLTTYDTQWLRVSVPPLGKLRGKILLIIYNDNPNVRITTRMIRGLGYRGALRIINGAANVGTIAARCRIADEISKMRHCPEWITYVDDDDILTNAVVPCVADDVFAVIQDSVAFRGRVADLFRISDAPECISEMDDRTVRARPNVGFAGMIIRTSVMIKFAKIMRGLSDAIAQIDAESDVRPPADAAMWTLVQGYARRVRPDAHAIYMDGVNYIKNELDANVAKYGRAANTGRGAAARTARVIARYAELFDAAMAEK